MARWKIVRHTNPLDDTPEALEAHNTPKKSTKGKETKTKKESKIAQSGETTHTNKKNTKSRSTDTHLTAAQSLQRELKRRKLMLEPITQVPLDWDDPLWKTPEEIENTQSQEVSEENTNHILESLQEKKNKRKAKNTELAKPQAKAQAWDKEDIMLLDKGILSIATQSWEKPDNRIRINDPEKKISYLHLYEESSQYQKLDEKERIIRIFLEHKPDTGDSDPAGIKNTAIKYGPKEKDLAQKALNGSLILIWTHKTQELKNLEEQLKIKKENEELNNKQENSKQENNIENNNKEIDTEEIKEIKTAIQKIKNQEHRISLEYRNQIAQALKDLLKDTKT